LVCLVNWSFPSQSFLNGSLRTLIFCRQIGISRNFRSKNGISGVSKKKTEFQEFLEISVVSRNFRSKNGISENRVSNPSSPDHSRINDYELIYNWAHWFRGKIFLKGNLQSSNNFFLFWLLWGGGARTKLIRKLRLLWFWSFPGIYLVEFFLSPILKKIKLCLPF
jgi:hypothetical protein